MKKNFSANLIFLLLLNLLIKPIYVFGVEVGIQNDVGPSEYGLYYAMFNFTFLFNVLLDMGVNNYQRIKVAEDEIAGMANMSSLIPLKLWLSIVYIFTTIAVALVLGFEGRYWYFIAWLIFNQILAVFLQLLRANLSGLHLFMKDSIVSVMDRLVLVIGIGYVLWFGSDTFQIEWFVVFQAASYGIAILLALAMTPANSRFPKLDFSFTSTANVLKKTWPFALLILLMTAYNRLDGIMIERLAENGLREAGIYAQAYRIIDAGNSFAYLYAGMLLPIFSRLIQHKNADEMTKMVNQSARFLILPAGIALLLMMYHANWFMQMLYDHEASASSESLVWLMGSFFFVCVGYVFGTLMTASNQLRTLNTLAVVSVIVNFALNFILIPTYGAVGAAIASFSSLSIMAISQVVFTYRTIRSIQLNWLKRSVFVWVLLFALLFGIDRMEWSEMNEVLIGASIGAVLFILLGLKKGDLKTLIPEEGNKS